MTDAAVLHRLEHATLAIARSTLRNAAHLSPAALSVLAGRPELLRCVTSLESPLPLSSLWDEAIQRDPSLTRDLVELLALEPELAVHFSALQLARYDSDIERLIELAAHPDPAVIEALLNHPLLFPRDPHHGVRPPPWEPVTFRWGDQLPFSGRPTAEQWQRLATLLSVHPALDSSNAYPLIRWLFDLSDPHLLARLLDRRSLRRVAAGLWRTPAPVRSGLLKEALEDQDNDILEALLLSRRLHHDEQALILRLAPPPLRALALRSGCAALHLLEELADDPDITRDLLDPDSEGSLLYHVDDTRASARLEFTLLTRFGLHIDWAIS